MPRYLLTVCAMIIIYLIGKRLQCGALRFRKVYANSNINYTNEHKSVLDVRFFMFVNSGKHGSREGGRWHDGGPGDGFSLGLNYYLLQVCYRWRLCKWYGNIRHAFFKIQFQSYMKYHYCDVIMIAMVSHITRFSIVYSAVCLGADQRKHQSSVLLAFVRWIHQWPVNSPHKGPVTRKMFPFDDVIMCILFCNISICRTSCLSTFCSWEEFSESLRCHCMIRPSRLRVGAWWLCSTKPLPEH